jgi:hypothetical protein
MFKAEGRTGRRILIVAFALLAAWSCGKRVYIAQSRIPRQEIVIDGKADDWQGALALVGEEALFIGFQNDRSNLYICLEAGAEREPKGLMRQGMTIWFDTAGENKKTLGVRYPLGGPPEGRDGQQREKEQEEAPAKGPGQGLEELEIIRSGKEPPERMTLEQAGKEGLEVSLSDSGGSFVYELKIPLASASADSPVSLGIRPGSVVGIGFETGKWNLERPPGQSRGDMGAGRGGTGGQPGGMGASPGGMGRGRGAGVVPDFPEPIKLWIRVRLTSGEPGSQPQILEMTPGPDRRAQ